MRSESPQLTSRAREFIAEPDWPATPMTGEQWDAFIDLLRSYLDGRGVDPEEAKAMVWDVCIELHDQELAAEAARHE